MGNLHVLYRFRTFPLFLLVLRITNGLVFPPRSQCTVARKLYEQRDAGHTVAELLYRRAKFRVNYRTRSTGIRRFYIMLATILVSLSLSHSLSLSFLACAGLIHVASLSCNYSLISSRCAGSLQRSLFHKSTFFGRSLF